MLSKEVQEEFQRLNIDPQIEKPSRGMALHIRRFKAAHPDTRFHQLLAVHEERLAKIAQAERERAAEAKRIQEEEQREIIRQRDRERVAQAQREREQRGYQYNDSWSSGTRRSSNWWD